MLLRLVLAVVDLAKKHRLKAREIDPVLQLVSDISEATVHEECHRETLSERATTLANELATAIDDLDRKYKAQELTEEQGWKERRSLHTHIGQARERVKEMGNLDEHKDIYKAVAIYEQVLIELCVMFPRTNVPLEVDRRKGSGTINAFPEGVLPNGDTIHVIEADGTGADISDLEAFRTAANNKGDQS